MEKNLYSFKTESEAQSFISALQNADNMSEQQLNMLVVDESLTFVTTCEEGLLELANVLDNMSTKLELKLDNVLDATKQLKQLLTHDFEY